MRRRQPSGTSDGGRFASEPRKRAEIGLPKARDRQEFEQVLESAARLQRLVPDAVLVGGSAAALHAGHRLSFDHDHVVTDLHDRFEAIFDAIESDEGWALNRQSPGKIILGELDGIETGIRQLIRARPLVVEQVELSSGATLTVPTIAEALRIKAFLAVRRNQVRDYLDIAALADRMGIGRAAQVLGRIDDYYADQRAGDEAVSSQVIRQLAQPSPADTATLGKLNQYKGLAARWTSWERVTRTLDEIAAAMLDSQQPGQQQQEGIGE
jgi:hypothetical protein